jgi:hypothetical protein
MRTADLFVSLFGMLMCLSAAVSTLAKQLWTAAAHQPTDDFGIIILTVNLAAVAYFGARVIRKAQGDSK